MTVTWNMLLLVCLLMGATIGFVVSAFLTAADDD